MNRMRDKTYDKKKIMWPFRSQATKQPRFSLAQKV